MDPEKTALTNPHYLQGLGKMAGMYLEMLKGVGRKKPSNLLLSKLLLQRPSVA